MFNGFRRRVALRRPIRRPVMRRVRAPRPVRVVRKRTTGSLAGAEHLLHPRYGARRR